MRITAEPGHWGKLDNLSPDLGKGLRTRTRTCAKRLFMMDTKYKSIALIAVSFIVLFTSIEYHAIIRGKTVKTYNHASGEKSSNYSRGLHCDSFTNTTIHSDFAEEFQARFSLFNSFIARSKSIMPKNNSFLAATLSGGGRTRSKRSPSTEIEAPTTKIEKNKKRDRKKAQLNNSLNESFTGENKAKAVRKLEPELSGLSEEEGVKDGTGTDKESSPMSEEFDANWLAKGEHPLIESTPINKGTLLDLDTTLAGPLARIKQVTQNMHEMLRGDLEKHDRDNSPILPNYNATLTPVAGHCDERKKRDSVFSRQIAEAATAQGKRLVKNIFLRLIGYLFLAQPSSTTTFGTAQARSAVTSRKRDYNSSNIHAGNYTMNDQARANLEERIARDNAWPYEVAIFSVAYHDGLEKDLMTMAEKDAIGRGIDSGLQRLQAEATRRKTAMKVQIHEQIRLSAGMAVVNCKDEISAKWVMRAIDNIKAMAAGRLRPGLDLKSAEIKDAKPFRAYTIINTSKTDSWEETKGWLVRNEVNVEGLYKVNTRLERNLVFTAVDTKGHLQRIFEQGKRLKQFKTLATNISIKMTYGEDEKSESTSIKLFFCKLYLIHFKSTCLRRTRLKRTRHPAGLLKLTSSTGTFSTKRMICSVSRNKSNSSGATLKANSKLQRSELKIEKIHKINCAKDTKSGTISESHELIKEDEAGPFGQKANVMKIDELVFRSNTLKVASAQRCMHSEFKVQARLALCLLRYLSLEGIYMELHNKREAGTENKYVHSIKIDFVTIRVIKTNLMKYNTILHIKLEKKITALRKWNQRRRSTSMEMSKALQTRHVLG